MTRLESNTDNLSLTRFAGRYETMVNLTRPRDTQRTLAESFFDSLTLTREEARTLANDLLAFANQEERAR